MSDPRGWNKHKDAIEAAKKELSTELRLLGDKVTLDKIYALLEKGMMAQCVKNVQHQTYSAGGSEIKGHTFSISEVDTSKSFVFPNCSNYSGTQPVIAEFTPTSVTIKTVNDNSSGSKYHTISIQVIEFY